MNKRPIAIDLFAGAGGLTLGLEQAGFDVVTAVEIDPIHACIHKYNFPQWAVITKSVTNVTGEEIRRSGKLSPEDTIDLVAGGAPCQGFSLIGKRALDDPRNSLVKEYIRLIKELQPSYFLFENVKGLTIGKHCQFLEEIITELEKLDYQILQSWQVLNAKNYGVPQSRERLFLIGGKKDLPLPSYPQHEPEIITCYDALSDLPDAEDFPPLIHSDEVPFDYIKKASDYSALMRCSNQASWLSGYPRQWEQNKLTCSLRTNHTSKSRERFAKTPCGTVEKTSRFYKLSPDGVANTLRAGTDSARGAFTSPRPIHYKYDRCVTVREMARLQGFPDWFRFHQTKWHGARQIGNSVPPPLAYSIGLELIKILSIEPSSPRQEIKLGNSNLLKMNMSSACQYWGIENPIAKRSRKNNKKKTQIKYTKL